MYRDGELLIVLYYNISDISTQKEEDHNGFKSTVQNIIRTLYCRDEN